MTSDAQARIQLTQETSGAWFTVAYLPLRMRGPTRAPDVGDPCRFAQLPRGRIRVS